MNINIHYICSPRKKHNCIRKNKQTKGIVKTNIEEHTNQQTHIYIKQTNKRNCNISYKSNNGTTL